MGGAWLDMNDPSVGRAELDDMRFDRGRQHHGAFHIDDHGAGSLAGDFAGFDGDLMVAIGEGLFHDIKHIFLSLSSQLTTITTTYSNKFFYIKAKKRPGYFRAALSWLRLPYLRRPSLVIRVR